MKIKLILLVALISCWAISSANAGNCLCKEEGHDFCSCARSIVRPKPLIPIEAKPRQVCSLVGGAQEFKPIGDRCSCGNQIVRPAVLPKPCQCNQCAPPPAPPKPSPCGETIRAPSVYQGPGLQGVDVFARNFESCKPGYPADAVSLSLAYNNAERNKIRVPEEQLQFGFRKLPKNQPEIKEFANIAEERLYAVDGKVIELKPTKTIIEEDEEEELLEEEEEIPISQRHLGYSDIGYFPEKNRDAKFVLQSYNAPIQQCVDSPHLPPPGNCGFVRGEVETVEPVHRRGCDCGCHEDEHPFNRYRRSLRALQESTAAAAAAESNTKAAEPSE